MSIIDDVYDRLTWRDDEVVLVMSANDTTYCFRRIDVETVDTQVFVKMTEYGIDVHLDVLRPFMANGVLIKTAAELF